MSNTLQNAVYDIIIVGGGTAGCVLASRISENPSLNVLLLEAGESGKALFFSRTPVMFPLLFKSKHCWPIQTEPQVFADGSPRFLPRGKMLGGCSSMNGQIAHYGNPADFDEWAALVDDDTWSWKNFQHYFRKLEGYEEYPNMAPNNILGHSGDGPVTMGFNHYVTNTGVAFVEACRNVGIPFSLDLNNNEGKTGVGKQRTYINSKGRRVSAETAYLTDMVWKRHNLKIMTNVQVTKILTEERNNQKQAIGVQYMEASTHQCHEIYCKKEVILSAGAIHSPQILMLSGIGPHQQLQDKGIETFHDLPDVGEHMLDHPLLYVYYKDKSAKSPKFLQPKSLGDTLKMLKASIQYFLFGTGPLTINWGESAAFIRTDDPQLFPASDYSPIADSTSGPGSPDMELLIFPIGFHSHGDFLSVPSFSLHPILLRPTSEGTVELASNDPLDNPIVDPHYCETEADVERFVRALKIISKIARTEPLASLIEKDSSCPYLDHNMHLKTDEELIQHVKTRLETCYHPMSTCRMLPVGKGGVVDSRLQVHGMVNLRVCDASIFPAAVSGHTAATVIAVAEKLADMIQAEYHA